MNDEAEMRWSALTASRLREAGWRTGRSVPTEGWLRAVRGRGGIEMHEAARRFLAKFGGLVIDRDAVDRALGRVSFRLDPLAAEWDDKVFDVPGEESPSYLCPIGATDEGDGLGMAPNGAVYMGRDRVRLLADTPDEALERLIEGAGCVGEHELRSRWSPLTKRVLRAAGWDAERSEHVTVEEWERLLREQGGFEIHDAARCFLTEFGRLTTDRWDPGPVMPQSSFRFDPSTAAADREAFIRLSRKAGASLYPIGLADSGRSQLSMAPNGAVYIGEDVVEPLADSGYEAVEKLVMQRPTEAPLPFVLVNGYLELPHSPDHDLSAEIGTRWSAETDRVLRLAGWRPGRSVPTAGSERALQETDEAFQIHEAARRFLTEFGGLDINQRGPGRTMARSPFRLDPLVAKWDYEIFEFLSEEAGTHLYPIGGIIPGGIYLGMAPYGAVHVGLDSVELLADTADEALDKLIMGIR